MRRCKPYRLISIVALLLALGACGSAPEPSPKPHSYQQASKTLESLASQSIQSNHFGKASKLYGQLFERYAAINDANGMWRSGLNQVQMLLAMNATQLAESGLAKLSTLAQLYPSKSQPYQDQLQILQLQLLVAKHDWAEAMHSYSGLPASVKATTAARINVAIIQQQLDQPAAQQTLNTLLQEPLSKLQKARLLRVQAALNPANGINHLQQALHLYGEAHFLPGTAACYLALAELANTPREKQWYLNRAAAIEKLLRQ